MEVLSMGAELFHGDGQTEGHEEASSRFSQFYELAYRLLINEQLCKRNTQELMYKIVRIHCRIVHLLLLYDLFCSSQCKE